MAAGVRGLEGPGALPCLAWRGNTLNLIRELRESKTEAFVSFTLRVSEHVCLVGLETGQADQDWFDFIFSFIAEQNSAGSYSVKHSQPSTLPTSCPEVWLEELRSGQARPDQGLVS